MSSAAVKFYKITTDNTDLNKVQDNLIRTLNPVFNTPILNGSILQNVALVAGSNIVNHKLGRDLLGWKIVRQRAAANIYDNQDNNLTPSKNLLLISDAPVIVDIYVF